MTSKIEIIQFKNRNEKFIHCVVLRVYNLCVYRAVATRADANAYEPRCNTTQSSLTFNELGRFE